MWFAAETKGVVAIYSLDLNGHQRKLFESPIPVTLHDISGSGDVLVTFDQGSPGVETLEGADPTPKDHSWRGRGVNGVSADHTLLISTTNITSANYFVGVQKPNGDVVQIADGFGWALSLDGSKAIVATVGESPKLSIVPTGAGQPQGVDVGPIRSVLWAGFLPDGQIVVKVGPVDSPPVTYLLSPAGRDPKPLLPDGVTLRETARNVISPDGANIVATTASGQFVLCTIATPSCRPLAGFKDADDVAGWNADSKSIYVFNRKVTPTQIDMLDVATGKRTVWKTLHTLNPSAAGITYVFVNPDGFVTYGYRRDASQLYVIKGLK